MLRLMYEQQEIENLSKYATKSVDATRDIDIEKCDYRTEFQRDRDRIIHSASFRRLMNKTQVFIAPNLDNYRNRLTHTLEVSQIARSIARGIKANEDLTEAIALAHDIGHTPFGHTGEDILNEILKDKGGYKHSKQSVRVVSVLEKDGKGLNLTHQTINGIENHGSSAKPSTIEGQIVQISDKIAYVNHDIEDSIRAKIITADELPKECTDILGDRASTRVDFLIRHIVEKSTDSPNIVLDDEVHEALYGLRKFLFQRVYLSDQKLSVNERAKIVFLIKSLYKNFYDNPNLLPEVNYKMLLNGEDKSIVVADHIASMSDSSAINTFKQSFVPKEWEA